MTFAAPLWLALAGAAAIGVLVAHLFAPSTPARTRLPTTRFIPQDAPLAVLRTNRLSDWLLLLLRLAVCALIGLALAGAHVPRRAPSRVLIVDASRAVGNTAELRDSARAHAADVIILADSAARTGDAGDLASVTTSHARGNLSGALVAAHRALQGFGEGRADAELVIVSPFVTEQVDSATRLLLDRWEGPVSLVRVAAAGDSSTERVDVRAEGDDPVAAAFALRPRPVGQRARVLRILATTRDSAWARDSAGVLVLWPSSSRMAASTDTAAAVTAGRTVVVGPFARSAPSGEGRIIARWNDGAAAATEAPLGRGCVRNVSIPVDAVGDVALRASFRDLAYHMVEPCGGAREFSRVELPAHAPATPAPQLPAGREPVWFALAALALLIAEQLLRSRQGRAVAA